MDYHDLTIKSYLAAEWHMEVTNAHDQRKKKEEYFCSAMVGATSTLYVIRALRRKTNVSFRRGFGVDRMSTVQVRRHGEEGRDRSRGETVCRDNDNTCRESKRGVGREARFDRQ